MIIKLLLFFLKIVIVKTPSSSTSHFITLSVLVCILFKSKQVKLVIEKATELGVSMIQPLHTDRVQQKEMSSSSAHHEKMELIAMEAAEQSERLTVPILRQPKQLTEVY